MHVSGRLSRAPPAFISPSPAILEIGSIPSRPIAATRTQRGPGAPKPAQLPETDLPMPDKDRIIRLRAVLARTGLSRSTLYRKIGDCK